MNVLISARTARSYSQCFSILLTAYSDQKLSNLCQEIIWQLLAT